MPLRGRKGGLVRQYMAASQVTAEETQSEKRARRAANEARRKANREMHALRSDFELKLQVSLAVHTVKHLCMLALPSVSALVKHVHSTDMLWTRQQPYSTGC